MKHKNTGGTLFQTSSLHSQETTQSWVQIHRWS